MERKALSAKHRNGAHCKERQPRNEKKRSHKCKDEGCAAFFFFFKFLRILLLSS